MIRAPAFALVALAFAALVGRAQAPGDTARGRGASSSTLGVIACPVAGKATPPTQAQRLAARALVRRGQQAAILGDRASAREQFRQAAALDPTDADLAYELARAHDGAGAGAEAAREYCRFLALAPAAPEAAEARERVALLSSRPRAPVLVTSVRSPANALALGLIVPGAGQFYVGRPVRGMLTLGAAGVAIAYGISAQAGVTSVQETALDPFGNPYTYTTTRATSSRPHLVPGLAAAGVIAVASAIDAYSFSRRDNDARVVALRVAPAGRMLAIGITVAR